MEARGYGDWRCFGGLTRISGLIAIARVPGRGVRGYTISGRLAAGYCAYDQEGLFAGYYGLGQRGVRILMGEIFLAGEEAQKGSALFGAVIANRAFQHGIALFDGIEDGTLCNRSLDFDGDFVAHVRQRAQMLG